LVVKRRPGSDLDADGMLDFMRGKVANWRLPDDVVFVDDMPMTGTGKIQKSTLRNRFRDYRLPGTPGHE
jgi:fatty-acyl-CoA synthase